ncbi:MAG: alginate lyase family protein [Leeuwenhoekiella sp.]
MRKYLHTIILCAAFVSTLLVRGQSSDALTYLDVEYMEIVQEEIDKNNRYFTNALRVILENVNRNINRPPNPVTNKTQVPPSGDMQDYLSIAPYLWPDPSKSDGLPWIGRDGEINPTTRGDNTDIVRAGKMRGDVEDLGIALYYYDEDRYAERIKELLNVWFIDPETRMNPNLNYAQSHPGKNDGNWFGIIEWGRINQVISTIEIMELKNRFTPSEINAIKAWFAEYLNWLETSSFGNIASNRTNNHAVWYYRNVMGINMFLGNDEKAKSYIEDVKNKLIKVQIEPDGSMPRELARTNSVDYTATNIEGFLDIAKMAEKLGVDLYGYTTDDGRSIRKTIDFLKPYLNGEKTWQWQNIKYETIQKAFEGEIYPLLSRASRMFNTQIMPVEFGAEKTIGNFEKLIYPPLSFPQVYEDGPPEGYVFAASERGTVVVTGTVDIAYGANGVYYFLYNQSADVTCDSATFGGDPIRGTVKSCYVKSSNLSLEDELLANRASLSIYPNPARGSFTVQVNNTQAAHVNIYDVTGLKVYSSDMTGNEVTIDRTFNSGIYLIQTITSDDKAITKKLIVR